ncbi:MAG: LysR family transcriptional regulator [Aquificota bacterium]|nr:LysR family transcriptional regulator [Aquificota bacterium]
MPTHASQSTLSFHLKNLEKQVGQRLFYRKGRQLVPTTIADRLYDYARELMDFKLRLVEDIGRFSGRKGSHQGRGEQCSRQPDTARACGRVPEHLQGKHERGARDRRQRKHLQERC